MASLRMTYREFVAERKARLDELRTRGKRVELASVYYIHPMLGKLAFNGFTWAKTPEKTMNVECIEILRPAHLSTPESWHLKMLITD